MITNDYTPSWWIFCVMGLYMHIHLYMESISIFVKNFFWHSSNHTMQVCSVHKHSFFFFLSLLIFLPYKQYFSFKLLSPRKTLSTTIIFCPHLPFLLGFLLFYFQLHKIKIISCNNSFLMLSPNPIFPLNSHTPPSQKCLLEKEERLFFSACP